MHPPPPTVTETYNAERALGDLPAIKYVEALFLNSDMVEAEEYCNTVDPKKEHLYITSGYSLIQCLKAVMSYEDKDLREALKHVDHGNALAARHRGSAVSLTSRFSGFVTGAPSLESLKAMTPVQRHAELLYAETLFAKALLATVSSGSWLAFIKEALSFRQMINIYMRLGKYVKTMDAAAAACGNGPIDQSIDNDFRSGVQLGVGASNLILSLMPKAVISVAELFGYSGDRHEGLSQLMRAGGWTETSPEPTINADEEGLRRPLADIALLVFHLVLSSFIYDGVDISVAEKILTWNLRRYPKGVFWLFGEGRLRLLRSQPELALQSYQHAMEVQKQYRNMHYISFWEIAIADLALWDIQSSLDCWRVLSKEATWSPACYLYGLAVSLLELGGEEHIKEAVQALKEIPKVVHKVAGKSIPIEKFVARKARKFESQGNRLLLPALELSYMFLAIGYAPRDVITSKMIPRVDAALANLQGYENVPASYEGGHGYWDDLCLAQFLEGVCMRYMAYPEADAVVQTEDAHALRGPAAMRALRAFKAVVQTSHRIELDHYIIYHNHYELGRLYACLGNVPRAREHIELVLSGKALEASPKARKGKYSMQSSLILRATAAMEQLRK